MHPLEDHLARMRAALQRADFAALPGLAAGMEAALGGLRPPLDAAMLARLRKQSQENATLLDASRRGLRAARRRLEEVRRAASGLHTYDGKGQMADIKPSSALAGRF